MDKSSLLGHGHDGSLLVMTMLDHKPAIGGEPGRGSLENLSEVTQALGVWIKPLEGCSRLVPEIPSGEVWIASRHIGWIGHDEVITTSREGLVCGHGLKPSSKATP